MLISPVRLNLLSFKGANGLGVKKMLPNPQDYMYQPLCTTFEESEKKEKEYKDKVNSLCILKNGKLHPLIKEHLDESRFIFEFENQKPMCDTIKNAIQSQIIEVRDFDSKLFHSTDTTQTREKILKNGFDPKFISRTKFGPGFYFAFTEGDALEYNSAKLKARCKGKCARINGAYYDKIVSMPIAKSIEDFIGLEPCGYPVGKFNYEICSKILNEYVRNLFIEDLGYDLAYGSDRTTTCIVAHNPNAISEIEAF